MTIFSMKLMFIILVNPKGSTCIFTCFATHESTPFGVPGEIKIDLTMKKSNILCLLQAENYMFYIV